LKNQFLFLKALFILMAGCIPVHLAAQDNYEIQVYESKTTEKGHTVFELHSNYTPKGNKQFTDKVFPSDKIFHETAEITHGFNNWFEIGGYFFNAIGSDGRTGYGGSHFRPRVMVPVSAGLPFGLSLGSEIGYQRLGFFNNHWLFEIHPIIDKEIGRFYFSVNPTFDWNIDKSNDFEFNPSVKASCEIIKKIGMGLEWYSGYGPIQKMLPWELQRQLLFLATDIDFGENWEFNAGIGYGLTPSTDAWIIKCILGRRFAF
jgi:hypothetical protein